MFGSCHAGHDQVVGPLGTFEFNRFLLDLLSSNWREETNDQDQPGDEETLDHRLFEKRLNVFSRPAEDRAVAALHNRPLHQVRMLDRKSTRLNSSHGYISYAV